APTSSPTARRARPRGGEPPASPISSTARVSPDRQRARRRGRDGALLRLGLSLALTLLLVAATPLTREAGLLADLEARSLDARFRLRGPKPPGTDIALIMIDERTVQAYGRWPLPRERL